MLQHGKWYYMDLETADFIQRMREVIRTVITLRLIPGERAWALMPLADS